VFTSLPGLSIEICVGPPWHGNICDVVERIIGEDLHNDFHTPGPVSSVRSTTSMAFDFHSKRHGKFSEMFMVTTKLDDPVTFSSQSNIRRFVGNTTVAQAEPDVTAAVMPE
jgi:hypothetical protein